jgi:hypothetical protein
MHLYIQAYVHKHMHMLTQTREHTHNNTYKNIHAKIHMHTRTKTYTDIMCAYKHTCMDTYIHNICMRAHIHTQPQEAKLIADVGFPIQEYPTVAILVFLVKGS